MSLAFSSPPPARLLDEIAAMACESRLRVLYLLGSAAGCGVNVTEIGAILGIGQPTVSHCLGILSAHGLIEGRRVGRNVFHQIASPRIFKCLEELAEAVSRETERR